MKDIESRKDIELIVHSFYDKLLASSFLLPIFKNLDLAHHLPIVINFWENMLFQTGNYGGGMMWVHLQVNQKTPLSAEHFEHWLALFYRTLDENFEGKNVEFMKKKSLEIGQIMNAKMQQ